MAKTSKRALLLSALAIVLCIAMLIGTTYAWFTDTASTGVNKIQTGNLDIEVEYTLDGEEWANLDGATDLFQKGLWEPGHTEVVALRFKNNGSLALKYTISMNIVEEKAGINKSEQEYRLSDYLKVKTLSQEASLIGDICINMAFSRRNDGLGYTGTANFKDSAVIDHDLLLPPGEVGNYLIMKVYMPETVGNEANAISADKAAYISFGLNVVATQATHESDSYGIFYDKDATYPATNSAELSDAIGTAGEGETINVVPGNYELPATGIPAGVSVSGAGMGKTNLTAPATTSGNSNTGLIVNQPDVTISNATITGHEDITSNMYSGLLDIREGGTTLDSVEIVNRTSQASGVVINRGVGTDETVTMKNSKLNVYYRAFYIVDGANGTVEIDNCDITGSIYALNVNSASSQELVIKCTNSKLHGWSSYGEIKSASFENVEFSKGASSYDYLRPYADTTLKNCTFDAEFKMGAGKTGFTITIENCTYNGTAVTASNVCDLMFDSDDLDNLKGCTITVNGVTVVL